MDGEFSWNARGYLPGQLLWARHTFCLTFRRGEAAESGAILGGGGRGEQPDEQFPLSLTSSSSLERECLALRRTESVPEKQPVQLTGNRTEEASSHGPYRLGMGWGEKWLSKH